MTRQRDDPLSPFYGATEAGEEWITSPADVPIATYWPGLAVGAGAGRAWEELRRWVDQLRSRFPPLDHHVIPTCWWRHNEHVELLVALRDHERCGFAETSPATAPIDWFRALRDAASMLSSWTSETGCSAAQHVAPPSASGGEPTDWGDFVAACRRPAGKPSGPAQPPGDGLPGASPHLEVGR
jgi:hypothetical protein